MKCDKLLAQQSSRHIQQNDDHEQNQTPTQAMARDKLHVTADHLFTGCLNLCWMWL